MAVPWIPVLTGGVIGAGMTQYLTHRFLPVAEIFRWDHWQGPWWAGAIAGTLIAYVTWVAVQPRARASRAAALCALANVVVWASFLIVSPPLDDAEFRRLETRRLQSDAASGGIDLTTDQPRVAAARWHGTFGALNAADRLLTLAAAPAIEFAVLAIVPARYLDVAETKRESFAIAGLGFALSTAIWFACGNMASSLRCRHRSRAAPRRAATF